MPTSTSNGDRPAQGAEAATRPVLDRVARVLVVDDSAYVRKVVRELLSRSPFLEVVGTAHEGREALDRVAELQPDVVVCDLIMPGMDGVSFIREQMARKPLPVVVLSIASDASESALAALDAGAIDFVHKPTALATEKIYEIGNELVDKVKTAATAAVHPAVVTPPPAALEAPRAWKGTIDVVVIGISTGGPQGLKSVIPRLPGDLPVPVAIVMHMPPGYLQMYAEKLSEMSRLEVKEAEEGDELRPGVVLMAPSGYHLVFRRAAGRVVAHLDLRPADTPHRPAVDLLFRSAAEVYGEHVLGVVMTGMGVDGRDGAAWVKAKGGRVLTEAEASCVVYGMPRAVVEAGLSDGTAALGDMAEAIASEL